MRPAPGNLLCERGERSQADDGRGFPLLLRRYELWQDPREAHSRFSQHLCWLVPGFTPGDDTKGYKASEKTREKETMDPAQRLTSGESIPDILWQDVRLHRGILLSRVALIGSRSPIYCKKLGEGPDIPLGEAPRG
jgi:hypothetical protein